MTLSSRFYFDQTWLCCIEEIPWEPAVHCGYPVLWCVARHIAGHTMEWMVTMNALLHSYSIAIMCWEYTVHLQNGVYSVCALLCFDVVWSWMVSKVHLFIGTWASSLESLIEMLISIAVYHPMAILICDVIMQTFNTNNESIVTPNTTDSDELIPNIMKLGSLPVKL